MIDINECGAPILCECEECGTTFWDTESEAFNREHTPAACLAARGLRPERDEESERIERLHDDEGG